MNNKTYELLHSVEDRLGFGEVTTPPELINKMLDTLPSDTWTDKTKTFLDPCFGNGTFLIEIIKRLRSHGHSMENIESRVSGYEISVRLFNKVQKLLSHYNFSILYNRDFLNTELDMKFDVVVGNPPYQDTTGASEGRAIWHLFVEEGFKLVKDNGYLSFVHPNSWRSGKKTFQGVLDIFTVHQMEHLVLGNYETGKEIFGVSTSVDWYVLKKAPNLRDTKIIDINGEVSHIRLEGVKRLPDSNINLEGSVLSFTGENTLNILYNTKYHTQKEYVSKEKSEEYKYPVVYTLRQGGPTFIWTNDNTKGHFGVPKVILGRGLGRPVLDLEGEYGTCEFSYSIVETPENLVKIYNALNSDSCIKLLKEIGSGKGHNYKKEAVSLLNSNFHEEFLQPTI